MRLVKFNLVVDKGKEAAEISVNPEYVENIVEGTVVANKDVTQITMTSGTKFFITHSYNQVVEIISKGDTNELATNLANIAG